MSKRLIVLVLAAAGSLALVLWFALGLGSSGARSSFAADSRETAPGDVAPRVAKEAGSLVAPAPEPLPVTSAPEVVAPAPADTRTDASRRSSAYEEELAKARWVEGRLFFPPGTPADERVFLTARGRDFEHGPEHRVEVPADGSFRIAFSEKTRKGSLAFEARFLYLEETVRIDFKEEVAPLVLEPELGGRIQGRLILPEDGKISIQDLAGSSVDLQRTTQRGNSSSSSTVRTAKIEAPAFDFDGLAPDGDYGVSLDTELGYAPQLDGLAVEAGKTREIELEFRPGVTLEGRVQDETGAPAAEIDVQANSSNPARGLRHVWRMAKTGSDGTFRLRGLSPGTVTVHVNATGFEREERELTAAQEGELLQGIEFVLKRGFQIAGRVQWPDGSQASKAMIEVQSENPAKGWFQSSFPCAEDGSFVASGLLDASYRLEASGVRTEEVRETSKITGKERTRKKHTTWRATAEHVQGGASGLVLVLDPGLSLAGLVRDDLGTPLDDFQVEARPGDGQGPFRGYRSADSLLKSFKDAGGRFELGGFTPGAWSVAAKAKGHAASFPFVVQVPDELANRGPIELVVPRTGRIEGVVVDPGGRGVGGAEVSWIRGGEEPVTFSFSDEDSIQTDAAGRFMLEEVDPGSVALHASSGVAAPSEPVVVELSPGGFVADVELRLRRGGRITGQVVDASGAGLPEREVDLWSWEGNLRRDAATDAAGRFSFENLPAGHYQVSSDPAPEEIAAIAGEGSGDLGELLQRNADVELEEEGSADLILAPPEIHPVRLHGRVTAGQRPLSQAFLWSSSDEGRSNTTQTDAEGVYELVLAGPGHHRIQVNDSSTGLQSGSEIDVPDVARFAFDIEIAAGTISGRVFGPDGSPQAGVAVLTEIAGEEAFGWSPTGGQTTTEADGAYRLSVPAATYDVIAGRNQPWGESLSSFAPGRIDGVVVGPGGEISGIDITLRRGGSIEGTVKRADGGSIAMAWIWVANESDENVAVRGTDATGAFRIDGLEPGRLRVHASDNQEHVSSWTSVEVRVGETTRTDILLVTGTTLRARVVDASGAAIQVEQVELLGPEGEVLQVGWVADDGLYWLGVATPGDYVVRASHQGKTFEQRVRAASEPELTLELCIE